MSESVKVAVRVRPFNKREKDLNSTCCIEMVGNKTTISDSQGHTRDFTFDHSYWSHDGFDEQEDGLLVPCDDIYADQTKVFDDLGRGVLENAFAGYNTSLFAYGQTGSGKSYSMVGYGANKGIVPITCEALFDQMEEAKRNGDSETRYSIKFSMLEIYNEKVRDLLTKPSHEQKQHGLKVAENTKTNKFEVKGLKSVAVFTYKEIENLTEMGTKHRTVASTKMNNTSSRAHTIISILFEQITKENNREKTKRSEINLVDLAGSERAGKTGAEGQRLKEGANINKSLGTLGKVIQALAKRKGSKEQFVPYRESVLTKLLMNALGGNSKTVMIAALSPASDNYEETLGTLRYADQAKQIKNKATVNESATDKLIRELRSEIETLKMHLMGNGNGTIDPALLERMAQMQQDITFQTNEISDTPHAQLEAPPSEHDIELQKKETIPYFTNLNEDPALSHVISHFIELDEVVIASFDASTGDDEEDSPFIFVSGFGVRKRHAVLSRDGDSVFIEAGSAAANTKVNGQLLTQKIELKHNDRVLVGSNCTLLFINPLRKDDVNEGTPARVDFQFAQEELTKASGLLTDGGSSEEQERMAQIMELFPMVTEINAVSDEMQKKMTFSVQLVDSNFLPQNVGVKGGPVVMVKAEDVITQNEWFLTRGEFVERRFEMQEMYGNWAYEGDEMSPVFGPPLPTKGEDGAYVDPFYFEPSSSVVGIASVLLLQLSVKFDLSDTYNILDHGGNKQGGVEVVLEPCDENGDVLDEDLQGVDDPTDLLGTDLFVKMTIEQAEVTQAKYSHALRCICQFGSYGTLTTDWVSNTTTPKFNASKVFAMKDISEEMIRWLEEKCVYITLESKHKSLESSHRGAALRHRTVDFTDSSRPSSNLSTSTNGGDIAKKNKKIEELEKKLKEKELKEAEANKKIREEVEAKVREEMEKGDKDETKDKKDKKVKPVKDKESRRRNSINTVVHSLQTKLSTSENKESELLARIKKLEEQVKTKEAENKILVEKLKKANNSNDDISLSTGGNQDSSAVCIIL
eukprot:m.11732 g.11732  ORF g.11732 m.11732 type:complete len:1033 (-) comp3880_c0_seq1:693-3791(-)